MQVIQRTNKLNHKKRSSFASGFFLHLLAIALRLPNSNGEQETQREISGIPLRSRHPSMFVFLPIIMLAFGLLISSPVSAAESKLDLTMSSDNISLDIGVTNASGTFKKSANNTITASTDNLTGYTLSVKTTDTSASTTPPALKNGSDTMPSITSAVTEEQFSSLTATNYNNKYGYLPSKLNSAANTSFLPSPDLTGNIIDRTSVANTTPNEYTMAIGARIDQTIPFGSYSNTFEVLLVANAIPYTIIYNDNVVGNMPVDVDTTSATSSVQISSKVPSREDYSFLGWCTVIPTNSNNTDSCTGGDTYAPNATYNLSQTTSNNLNLYAMWSGPFMQDFTIDECQLRASNNSYMLFDKRDNKNYTVRYINGNCWMTQNLRVIGLITAELSNFSGADFNVCAADLSAGQSYDQARCSNSLNEAYGVWYNYAAVSVGTIVGGSDSNLANVDICPSGWKLPTTEEYSSIIPFASLFSPSVGGTIITASPEDIQAGRWWTKNAIDGQKRTYLYKGRAGIRDGDMNLGVNDSASYRYAGNFVRCVLQK